MLRLIERVLHAIRMRFTTTSSSSSSQSHGRPLLGAMPQDQLWTWLY